jgi:apolipoprotein D and lipocalin family protein
MMKDWPAWARRSILSLCLGLAASAAAASPTAPEPQKAVDPVRYIGRWYEIARVPNSLQEKCQAATSDWSRHSDGQFDVVQTCRIGSPSGPSKVWRAAGRVLDGRGTKIRLGFFGGFVHQDYWIVDRGDDYSWCIMGTPNPKYIWIMSRRPVISGAQRLALVDRARALGYDTGRLVFDQQPPAG